MKPDVFEKHIIVKEEDIDFNGHVNNLKYLEWMINAAVEHSESLGFNAKTYKKIGSTWFVKSHHIEYKQPAFLNDELVLKTWIDNVAKITSTRKYEIYKNDRLLAYGETIWVFVDINTHRPKKIPKEVIEKYYLI